jgi:hypothetical protein
MLIRVMSMTQKQSKQWKDWEREVARDLGGTRTGPRGFDVPDVIDLPQGFAPECKYQKRLSLKDADLKQADHNARGNEWSLFLREAQTGRRLVVVPYKTFLKMWDAYKQEIEDNE